LVAVAALTSWKFPNLARIFEQIDPNDRKVGTVKILEWLGDIDVVFMFLPEVPKIDKDDPDFQRFLSEYTRAWKDCVKQIVDEEEARASRRRTFTDVACFRGPFLFALPVWAEPSLWPGWSALDIESDKTTGLEAATEDVIDDCCTECNGHALYLKAPGVARYLDEVGAVLRSFKVPIDLRHEVIVEELEEARSVYAVSVS
jgi:hypothetical protein